MTTPNDAKKAASFEAFKQAWLDYPSQDNEGYVPERGSFKCGWFAGAAWQAERDKAELERYKNDADRSLQLMALTMESQSAQLERMRAVVEAAKEMRDLLHLRLRYCPEALWLEENYIKLKDALAALKRGGDK